MRASAKNPASDEASVGKGKRLHLTLDAYSKEAPWQFPQWSKISEVYEWWKPDLVASESAIFARHCVYAHSDSMYKWCRRRGFRPSGDTMAAAAFVGDMDALNRIMKTLHEEEKECPQRRRPPQRRTQGVWGKAAGRLSKAFEAFSRAFFHRPTYTRLERDHSDDCDVQSSNRREEQQVQISNKVSQMWYRRTFAAAARGGHLHVVEHLCAIGGEWDDFTLIAAAASGHHHVLAYVHDRMKERNFDVQRVSPDACAAAARSGRLDTLQWLHARGFPWDARTCAAAASRGHGHILRWAREQGCPCDKPCVAHGACLYNHFGIAMELVESGCPYDAADLASVAARAGRLDVIEWLDARPAAEGTGGNDGEGGGGGGGGGGTGDAVGSGVVRDPTVVAGAAMGGHLHVLAFLFHRGWHPDVSVCNGAAIGGHMDVLKYAREHACPWGERTCMMAARGGHLDVLKYLHENGCPWDERTCTNAAWEGHLDVLKYAHENGCPWDTYTCKMAAEGGHLDVLKYAHENGCPWDDRACLDAAEGGHLDVLVYLRENGCPWDVDFCLQRAQENRRSPTLLAWLEECSNATERIDHPGVVRLELRRY